MNKQTAIDLLRESLYFLSSTVRARTAGDIENHDWQGHGELIAEIDSALNDIDAPKPAPKKKALSAEHKRRISASMRGNKNYTIGQELKNAPMRYVPDADGALVLQRVIKPRQPMTQETKAKIAESMKGNKNNLR